MAESGKIKILGKNLFLFEDLNHLVDSIKPKIYISLNGEILSSKNEGLATIINNHIGYADGIGAVLAAKRKGYSISKIPGVELWLELIKRNNEKSFFLIGSTQDVIEKTVEKLNKEFKSLKVPYYSSGYLSDEKILSLKNRLKTEKPDFVFIAMGYPKQEILANELFEIHPATYLCLGGSFDVYSGLKKRAPKVFVTLGLEWFYRLIKEPTRIKRQMALFKFGFKVLLNRV